MEERTLEVRMLGEFSIRWGDRQISDAGSRSRKVWLLLAYLICRRGQPVREEVLISLLWAGGPQSGGNLPNALKTILHRARALLDQLGEGMGRRLLLRRGGGCFWNSAVPLTLDAETFASLCQDGGEMTLERQLQALALYRGGFLPRLSRESWAAEKAVRFCEQYLQTAQAALPLLEERRKWLEAAALCRQAAEQSPAQEFFYIHWMTALLALGDQQGAASVYERMSERLLSDFGILPSDQSRRLYRDALRSMGDQRRLTPDDVLDQLREPPGAAGAFFCDYDFFKVICRAAARWALRSKEISHLALLSVSGQEERTLPKRSLDRAVDNLREVIRLQLRRGDVAARCSGSQFILLLPQADYPNSRRVCDRVLRAFVRQYPHSPAQVQFLVYPLNIGRSVRCER